MWRCVIAIGLIWCAVSFMVVVYAGWSVDVHERVRPNCHYIFCFLEVLDPWGFILGTWWRGICPPPPPPPLENSVLVFKNCACKVHCPLLPLPPFAKFLYAPPWIIKWNSVQALPWPRPPEVAAGVMGRVWYSMIRCSQWNQISQWHTVVPFLSNSLNHK